jgi:hypothetical protein
MTWLAWPLYFQVSEKNSSDWVEPSTKREEVPYLAEEAKHAHEAA